MRQLFLDAQLSLFEELDSRKVRPGSAQFLLDLPFQAGVLELQSAEMRMFHWGSSFFQPPKAARTDRYRLGIRRVTAIVMKTH